MNIAVTGGAGFIGANLCRSLLSEDWVDRVIALDDMSTGRRRNLVACGVELVEGSILDPALVDHVLQGMDAVVHLAARPSVPRSLADPLASHHANATGTVNVLEAARRHGGPQVVVASSSSVYGSNPLLPQREDAATSPVSPYGASKLASEAYALAYGRSFGLPVLAFRFFNVFGPLQAPGHAYAAVVPTFVACAIRGRPLPVHGSGTQTRDFTFVGSVTAVLSAALRRAVTHETPVNLAFGSRLSLLELIGLLERVLGSSLARIHSDPRPGDLHDSQADPRRLRSLFPGIDPVGVEEGLRATVNWLRGSP